MSEERDHQELLMLYQITVNDLSYFKTQQWAVATYAFLLYAAIAGIREIMGALFYEKILLTIFVIAILSAALVVITKLQDSIVVRQARLDATKSYFGEKFKEAWDAKSKGKEYIRSVWFLHAAVLFGAIVLFYVIWRV